MESLWLAFYGRLRLSTAVADGQSSLDKFLPCNTRLSVDELTRNAILGEVSFDLVSLLRSAHAVLL